MSLKLAVITDIHYTALEDASPRQGHWGDILLQRAVYRINRLIRPDAVVVLGDLINDGDAPDAPALRQRLMTLIEQLTMPVIILPGNHDGDPDAFYRDFRRPPDWLDIGGYRLLPFIDRPEPEYNARRTDIDLQRMTSARAGFEGSIIQIQHTSLFPPGASDCPYNFTNIDAVCERMQRARIRLSISGHYHSGVATPVETTTGTFVLAPALCETPFTVTEITFQGDQTTVTEHPLKMPEALQLTDRHIHTPLAYCADNMDVAKTRHLATLFGLGAFGFSEHSGQLYFNRDDYWSANCLKTGAAHSPIGDDRMDVYLRQAAAVSPPAGIGLEVDCDFSGQPLSKRRDRERVDHLLGAVHVLPSLRGESIDTQRVDDEFLATLDTFLACGIDVLAHPFRVFRRANLPPPDHLYAPTVKLLKRHAVAAEVNYHINDPDPVFIRQCLDAGVRLAFGSDAHNLAETGDFALHRDLLKRCGFNGDLTDVLY